MTLGFYPNYLLKKHLLNSEVQDEDDFDFPDSFCVFERNCSSIEI